ncbi:MAG: hypothetical protein WCK77_11660 [Verrucomicrobiota bacterium]
MKLHTLILAAGSVAASAFAGVSTPVTATAPGTEPSLMGWFIAGSFGQIYDVGKGLDADAFDGTNYDSANVGKLDFDMYNLQIGRDFGLLDEGFDMAAYLEVGYLDGSVSVAAHPLSIVTLPTDFGIDAQIIPVTANFKLEHAIAGPLSCYFSGGLGYAWTRYSGNNTSESSSANGGGFYAQFTTGLIYNINPHLEIFGGGRWLYLSNLSGAKVGFNHAAEIKLQDAWAWEAGIRFNF